MSNWIGESNFVLQTILVFWNVVYIWLEVTTAWCLVSDTGNLNYKKPTDAMSGMFHLAACWGATYSGNTHYPNTCHLKTAFLGVSQGLQAKGNQESGIMSRRVYCILVSS